MTLEEELQRTREILDGLDELQTMLQEQAQAITPRLDALEQHDYAALREMVTKLGEKLAELEAKKPTPDLSSEFQELKAAFEKKVAADDERLLKTPTWSLAKIIVPVVILCVVFFVSWLAYTKLYVDETKTESSVSASSLQLDPVLKRTAVLEGDVRKLREEVRTANDLAKKNVVPAEKASSGVILDAVSVTEHNELLRRVEKLEKAPAPTMVENGERVPNPALVALSKQYADLDTKLVALATEVEKLKNAPKPKVQIFEAK